MIIYSHTFSNIEGSIVLKLLIATNIQVIVHDDQFVPCYTIRSELGGHISCLKCSWVSFKCHPTMPCITINNYQLITTMLYNNKDNDQKTAGLQCCEGRVVLSPFHVTWLTVFSKLNYEELANIITLVYRLLPINHHYVIKDTPNIK